MLVPEEVGGVELAGGGVRVGGNGISIGFASGDSFAGAGSFPVSGSASTLIGSVSFGSSAGFFSCAASAAGCGGVSPVECKSPPMVCALKSVRGLGKSDPSGAALMAS